MFYLTVTLLCGIGAATFCPVWLSVCLGALLLGLAALVQRRISAVLLVSLVFLLGFIAGHFSFNQAMAGRLQTKLEGKTLVLKARVASLPKQSEKSVRFLVKPISCHNNQETCQLPKRITLSWYYPRSRVALGEIWQFKVRLKRVHGFANPGSFNYERFALAKGIGATGYVLVGDRLVRSSSWRQLVATHLHKVLPAGKSAGILPALVLGDRSELSPAIRQIFQATGTAHLIAISGLHIGLMSGLGFLLCSSIWRRLPKLPLLLATPQASAIAALLVALSYSFCAGMGVATVRALLMITCVMLAMISKRFISSANAYFIAIWGLLLWEPLNLLISGFWLSVTAVGLLIYGLSERVGSPRAAQQLVQTQWCASLGLLPLTLLTFQQITIVGPIANSVAIPLVGWLVVPLALLGTGLSFVSNTLATGCFWLAERLLDGLMLGLAWLAKLPWAQYCAGITMTQFSLLCLGVLLLLAPRGVPMRSLGSFAFLPLLFPLQNAPPVSAFELSLLDVGQGLSAVVRTKTHTLVFDTGPRFSPSFDLGRLVVVPFLRSQHIRQVDTLVVSHADNDHSGGAKALLNVFPVEQLFTSAPTLFADALMCHAGQTWRWDQVDFTFLAPATGSQYQGNNSSCVLRVSNGHQALLLTGDMEAKAEHQLAQEIPWALKADVIIAPHHGSRTSSSQTLLDAVQPTWVLFPVGYRNRFHFPSPVVVARYQQLQTLTRDTVSGGAIRIKFDTTTPAVGVTQTRESMV